MKKMYDILFLDTVDSSDIMFLSYLIEVHNLKFQQLFKKPLKPKHHILTHYPRIMTIAGPV